MIYTIYNTCGISGRDNVEYYIRAIYSLLNQDFKNHRIILSSCLNQSIHIDRLKSEFGKSINYSIINAKHTVNTTFNKTVQEAVKNCGESEGYLFIDSGCILQDKHIIDKAYQHFKTNRFGMISCKTDTDVGLEIPLGGIPTHNTILPIGIACNLHTQLFHNDIYKEFGRIIPDIFRSNCTESTFPYLNASINKSWLFCVDTIVQHIKEVDGPSSGFNDRWGWDDVFPPYNMRNIIADPEGTACGFGHEECNHIKMHNRDAYDEQYRCKDPQRLANFIKNNIFMSKDVLDYDLIPCEWS